MTRARDLARIANSNALSIDSNSNVGVGSTTPRSKLNVVGVVSATSFYGDGANLTGVISGVNVLEEGGSVGTSVTSINFVGSNVTATATGAAATITVSGGGDAVSDITGSLFF
jgi:hypothetical protein